MKKFFVSFALLVAASVTSVFAQSPLVATLNHNDTISVYYGIDALQSAYSASVNGDVITLSSGGFNAPSIISNNITLRGAGMEQDTVNKVAPTILIGDFRVYSGKTSTDNHLTIEGIWHDGTIAYGYKFSDGVSYPLSKAQFIKCRFNKFRYVSVNSSYEYSFRINDAKFVQCKIKEIKALGNATFLNCYVGNPGKAYFYELYKMNYECINCVVYGSLHSDNVNYSTFINSVLISSNQLDATNTVYNCVGVYTAKSEQDLFSFLPYDLSNVCYREVSEVFDTKTFHANGSTNYSDADTYQLLDSIRTKYLGTDGREVGMYGGALPFNPQSTLPKIKKFSVAPQTDSEGKLKVEIEVSAAGK